MAGQSRTGRPWARSHAATCGGHGFVAVGRGSLDVAAIRFGDPAGVAVGDLAEALVVGHGGVPAGHGLVVITSLIGEELFALRFLGVLREAEGA
jgi:hypothetical protein